MAKRHPTPLIPPFPPDIDRDVFGQHLSGFTDGEGCFTLNLTRGRSHLANPLAAYRLRLRADDKDILDLIHSYWRCGRLYHTRSLKGPGRPQYELAVQGINELIDVVVPHFERYPLFAKKKNDFLIWAEAVRFMHAAITRDRLPIVDVKARRTWTPDLLEKFKEFMCILKSQRGFPADCQPMSEV